MDSDHFCFEIVFILRNPINYTCDKPSQISKFVLF
jgi:hypothetical protein